jgi:hypothetical protein
MNPLVEKMLSERFQGRETPMAKGTRGFRESEQLINAQIQKLHEMRSAQLAFFDSKMIELRQKETSINESCRELEWKEAELIERQKYVENMIHRLKVEREEIAAIKELLKTETESVHIQSRDLKRLVNRYEQYVKPMLPPAKTLLSK